MRVVCECDGDLVGDPPHWVRSNPSTLCLEHDMCCVCDEAKAVILVDGDIGRIETAQKVAELAVKKFGSIDAVVANAGIFLVKPFTA